MIPGEYSILKKSKQRIFKDKIHGIDIETYDHNKRLLMTSIYNATGLDQVFIRQNKLIHVLKHDISFKNSILAATNLGFDFFGIFYNHAEKGQFNTLFRGSSLIYAKTKVIDGEFLYNTDDRNAAEIKFLDTMNYSPIGVKKAGELLRLPKLDMVERIGLKPGDASEWQSMILYNIRDSEISSKFMIFLKDSFEELGATFKDTIASTAMSLFKNVYLKRDFFRHDEDVLLEVMKSYYGGRCEVFKRGTTNELKYMDFNSLYPSVMHDYEFPDPNTMHVSFEQTNDKIMRYEGCSHVIIECPNMKYPLLPVRFEDKYGMKVIFPVGMIDGWYTHIELRKALLIGYHIIKVEKSIYYTSTCSPFKDYVMDLYNKRLIYQADGNPMQEVCKLFMNSLYGKFAQKFIDIENSIPIELITEKFLKKNDIIEIMGDYARYRQSYSNAPSFSVPIWASYVTSYGRLKLYDEILKHEPYYCDTDSIMTEHDIGSSNKLGEMKLEMSILEAVLVKPKFYALYGFKKDDPVEEVKIKGFSRAVSYLEIQGERIKLEGRKKKFLNYLEFKGFLIQPKAKYNKFVKFKEALRRHMKPNQDIMTEKFFGLEDDKRMWKGKFKINELCDSKPVIVSIGH